MDRCALFVDAGYVLTDGALAVHGTRNRDSVSWDYAGVLKLLTGLSTDHTGVPVLRCYWYDSAPGGDRTTEHDTVADLPGIKLRLSRARASRKEGVEGEIRRDLTALARNRAISDVVIVSGEEDLGSVIAEVQDLGIRTTLLHVAVDGDEQVSRALRQECDDAIEISAVHLRPFVDLIRGAEPAAADSQLAAQDYRQPAAAFGEPAPVGYRDPAHAIRAAAPVGYRDAPGGAHASGYPDRGVGGGQPQQPVITPAAALYPSPVPPDLHRAGQPSALGSAASGSGRDSYGQNSVAPSAAARQPNGHPGGTSPEQGGFSPPATPSGPESRQLVQNGQPGARAVPADMQAVGGLPASRAGHDMPANGVVNAGMPGAAAGGMGQERAALNGLPASTSGQKAGAQLSAGDPLGGAHAQPGPARHGQHHLPQQPGVGMAQPSREAGNLGMPQAAGPGSVMPSAGLAPGVPQPGPMPQAGPPQAGSPQGGMQQGGLPQGGLPPGPQHGGLPPNGMQQGGLPQGGLPPNGMPQGGLPPNGMQQGGLPPNGMQQGGLQQGGLPPNGMQQGGLQQGGLPPNAMPPNGLQYNGLPPNGLPAAPPPNGLPGGLPQSGLPQNVLPGGLPQNGLPPNGLPGGLPPSGPLPMESPRSNLPQRQLPAGNGMPYPSDRASVYGGHPAAGQQYDPAHGSPGYDVAPYGSPPVPALPPPVISVAEAVKSAHSEGYGFGEAVARDAPALWLEAVLARKPRMPSDLEARLLQGSALPIDSLLHDEVRHALRRGFWDALERSRH